MKKLILLFIVLLFCSPVFAAYFDSGYFSSNAILSDNLGQGKTALSADLQYWSVSEILDTNTNRYFEPTEKLVKSLNLVVIPIRAAYGLNDNISLRATVPYVTYYQNGDKAYATGIGIGDMNFEALFKVNPTVGINIGTKVASGKNANWVQMDELAVGTGSTDWWVTGVFKNKLGIFDTKALLGYKMMGSFISGTRTYFPGNALLVSVAGEYAANGSVVVGGEIWGRFSAPEKVVRKGALEDYMVADSATTIINLSPYIVYKASNTLSIRGVIDLPVATIGSYSIENLRFDAYRGVNISVGASMTI